MDLFTRNDLNGLLACQESPCLSIFLPTERGGGAGGPTRFRRCLAHAVEGLLGRGMRPSEVKDFLHLAKALLKQPAFWKRQGDGLAYFLAPGLSRPYRLPLSFEERVAVGPRFVITPLLPLVTGDDRFYVLALSQNGVRLLRGTRDTVSQVDLKGVPRSMEEALATHDVDEVLTYHTRPSMGGQAWAAIFHGHGVGIDDHKEELLQYFLRVDRGLHPLLRQERAPLVLAAVEYLHPIYRKACTYAHLVPEGLRGCPDHISDQELHDRAWPLVEPILNLERVNELALYRQLAGTGRTASGVEAVRAAARGQVEFLFAAAGRPVWGRMGPDGEPLALHEKAEPGDEDLVNLAAAEALRHGGTVHSLPAEQVPSGSPLAAVFWTPHARQGKGRQSTR